MAARRLRVISWNVNGLRSCTRKGFGGWLAGSGADIVGVQEVRALPEELDPDIRTPKRFHTYFSAAERRGYSGVGLFAKPAASRVETSLGEERFDTEGRVQLARFGKLVVANVYFPKGSGNARDNSRVPYKLDFYRALFSKVQRLRRGGARVLVMGDFNTAHREIDLARPKDNVKNSGFLPEEREELDRWLAAGMDRHLPDRATTRAATTPGGASAAAPARATSDGASTTSTPRRAPSPLFDAPSSPPRSPAPTTVRSASTSTPPSSARERTPAPQRRGSARLGRQIGYALGDVSLNTGLVALALVYANYFLPQIADIRPLYAGLIPLIGRVVDAFSDPLMGWLSDRTRTRFGSAPTLFPARCGALRHLVRAALERSAGLGRGRPLCLLHGALLPLQPLHDDPLGALPLGAPGDGPRVRPAHHSQHLPRGGLGRGGRLRADPAAPLPRRRGATHPPLRAGRVVGRSRPHPGVVHRVRRHHRALRRPPERHAARHAAPAKRFLVRAFGASSVSISSGASRWTSPPRCCSSSSPTGSIKRISSSR